MNCRKMAYQAGLKTGLILLAATVFPLLAEANQIEFTYNVGHEDSKIYGFDKKETYDIAIKITDPIYTGTRVKGIKVNLPVKPEWVKDCKGWVSSALKLENKKNAPDLATAPATVANDLLTVDFDSPVAIPASGLYVGYSFTVTELGDYSNKPICLIEGDAPDGLWVHTSRSRMQWTNLGETLQAVSTMTVILEGDFSTYDMAPLLPEECYAKAGEPAKIDCSFVNRGIVPVNSIDYEWTVGNFSGKGSYTFETPVACGKDNVASAPIEMTVGNTCGTYPMSVKVTAVNGQPNGSEAGECASSLLVMPLIPVNRPLVEEFTGLNCGYCPRGYVTIEQMKQLHGDDFIAMAYHSTSYEPASAMCTVRQDDFPVNVTTFPNGIINRDKLMDPSYFLREWNGYRNAMPVAAVDVTLTEDPDNHNFLKASAKVTFIRDIPKADYRISLALVGDQLTNPKWEQFNNFIGDTEVSGPFWDIFTKGERRVKGLEFNDVVVYYKDVQGVEGSVPAEIHVGDMAEYSIDIDKAEIVNLAGLGFINDGAEIKAVAILLDGEGKPVNCNKSSSLTWEFAGSSVEMTKAPIETEYYDLTGNRIQNPIDGIYIRIERMSDGQITSHKVIGSGF